MPYQRILFRCVVERSQQIITTAKVKDVQEVIREQPSKPSELLVIQTDGGMLPIRGDDWKESKLGVIYREENHAVSSETVRGCITEARYVGHLGSIDTFKEHMSAALKVERVREAEQVVWLGDGAPWNWNMADELCPWAVQILDAMHATSHAIDCAKVLFVEDESLITLWATRIKCLFYNATPEKLLDELGACRFGASSDELEAINALLNYYKNNQSRIQYAKFTELGFPIGSGTVESAHKHVLQKRMKLAGQHWNLRRAQGMVELRAAYRTTGPRGFYKTIRNLGQRRIEFGKRAA